MAKRIPFPMTNRRTPKTKYLRKIDPYQEVNVRDKRTGRVITIELASLFENDFRYEMLMQ